MGFAANHIVHVLRSFKAVVLRDFEGRGWFTSDNPVHIDYMETYGYIIPVEAEIYFPLSKEFCLFLYHDKSTKLGNPLRQLAINRVHELDEITHDWLQNFADIATQTYLDDPENILARHRTDSKP